MKIFYKTRATATGGRSGTTSLDDGSLSIELAQPGSGKAGANPEQLFALGYAACFDNALKHLAGLQKLPLASSLTSAEVGMGQTPEGGYKLDVDLHVTLAGLEQAAAEALLAKAHAICPYSNALRGNVDVRLHLSRLTQGKRTMKKILMVLTSHDRLGDTGKKTGFWLEEFAAPYYVFKDAGLAVTLASPAGGQPPLDPKSDDPQSQTAATHRFRADAEAGRALANTQRLGDVDAADFDAVFYPGGHGPLWDLAEDPRSIALIESTLAAGKPVGAVCHAPGVLRHARQADGTPLVRGRRVTGFTNSEEDAVQLTHVVPFLVEDMLKTNGGDYSKGPDWHPYAVVDGLLITGQNPASSELVAHKLLAALA